MSTERPLHDPAMLAVVTAAPEDGEVPRPGFREFAGRLEAVAFKEPEFAEWPEIPDWPP